MHESKILQRLRDAMRAKRIRQPELAELVGVSQSTVSRWLDGSAIADDKLDKIIEVLGIHREWLTTGAGSMEPASVKESEVEYKASSMGAVAPLVEGLLSSVKTTDLIQWLDKAITYSENWGDRVDTKLLFSLLRCVTSEINRRHTSHQSTT